ncbi:unnamed protein product [Urochloa decumbens]|uniref:Uncharacterized protein n=1 Tax=Urochloa decumbens TaxID=240449 RepID=A0ABC8XPA2_9POAL
MRHWRRHVYLLVNNFNRATYPLRRIDASSLFSSNTAGTASRSMKLEEARLPNPFISFTPPQDKHGNGRLDFFSLFGPGKNKSLIAGADQNGLTFMYDLDQRAVHRQVCLNEPKICNPISVTAGQDLYVLDSKLHQGGFEALGYKYKLAGELLASPDWRWHSLPPPPFLLDPGYTPTGITACTVFNDSEILISMPGFGTYSFKIASSSWRKAGDWELPFRGRANYFPEYGLWLGFSSQDNMLCSSDLKAASSMQSGPELVLNKDWEDLREQEGWIPRRSFLVHLGFGKFCAAKFFQTFHKEPSEEGYICSHIDNFAVLTGLTLHRGEANGELQMIRHMSQIYYFHAMTSGWVF